MKKVINFDFSIFCKGIEEKSLEVMNDVKLFDEMINSLMTVGISAVDFNILTAERLEQYRLAHTEDHDNSQLVRRLKMLPATKMEDCNNILF